MKRILYYPLVLVIVMLAACSEEKFTTFGGEVSGIYMQRDGSYTVDPDFGGSLNQLYMDSIEFTFSTVSPDITESTINIPVKIMGNVTDYDRPFILNIDETQTNAQRGVHYDFNESDCVIQANTARTSVPVTIYRTSDLTTGYFYIVFELESNEHFTTELHEYNSSSNWQANSQVMNGNKFRVIFSEIYTRPGYWDFAESFMGAWSATKEQRVNSLMGWTHRDWERGGMSGYPVQYGRMSYAAKLLRKDLQEAADAGTPVLDEDGSYMQLAPGYEVDYSAYE